MNLLRKIPMFMMDLIIIVILIINIPIRSFTCLGGNVKDRRVINIGVLLSNATDPFLSEIQQEFKEIQKENEGKVTFTFYDGKNNESIQKAALDSLLQKNIDLLKEQKILYYQL